MVCLLTDEFRLQTTGTSGLYDSFILPLQLPWINNFSKILRGLYKLLLRAIEPNLASVNPLTSSNCFGALTERCRRSDLVEDRLFAPPRPPTDPAGSSLGWTYCSVRCFNRNAQEKRRYIGVTCAVIAKRTIVFISTLFARGSLRDMLHVRRGLLLFVRSNAHGNGIPRACALA